MLIYQNLAYCRYLQLWSIFNLASLLKSNPAISLLIVSLIHIYNINLSNKRIFIVFQDYILIYCIFFKIKNENMREKNFDKYLTNYNLSLTNYNIYLDSYNIFDHNYSINDFYIKENIIFLIIYIKILLLFDINPIKLYTIYLPMDDKKYKNENFIKYFLRIWYLFIFDKILFNKFNKFNKKIKIQNKNSNNKDTNNQYSKILCNANTSYNSLDFTNPIIEC